ncbi:MAG: hypothetical protein E2576_11025 [Alcaligenaceae bacterium]|nr:hypothetical protein [Alcaligenaceae bacterium SAGV5]MPS51260.1 hypothetical protein [Alcaligenaceae bacterium SAGV3]MPT57243.1 hypothetical protein [Alcaligenaceae bacterium]
MIAHQAVLDTFVTALIGTPGVGTRVSAERTFDLADDVLAAIDVVEDGTASTEMVGFASESLVLALTIRARSRTPRAACYAILEAAHPRVMGALYSDGGQVKSITRLSHTFDSAPADVSIGEMTAKYAVTFEVDLITLQ